MSMLGKHVSRKASRVRLPLSPSTFTFCKINHKKTKNPSQIPLLFLSFWLKHHSTHGDGHNKEVILEKFMHINI